LRIFGTLTGDRKDWPNRRARVGSLRFAANGPCGSSMED
jgi:hypothetical protein